ncbi:MAG: hypothetical protein ACJ8EY_06425 [Sphingomicrobium sp.]
MAQNSNELPEGTDTIIGGASETGGDDTFAGGNISENDSLVLDPTPATSGGPASGSTSGTWTDKLRDGRENLTGQASGKARDLVGQGLERGGEALANVARMIGDTATGLDERLGAEYGDYARRAAGSLENAANSIASKNADELIDDTREFIRKSPGVALAGAAIVGFALARLVKNGLSSGEDSSEPRDRASAD